MKAIANFFDKIAQRYLPDAFIFAVVLTLIVFAMGVAFEEQSPVKMVQYWGEGFWGLLAFAMQMALVVVTGYVLANTPLVKGVLEKISGYARTGPQAIMLVTVVAMIGSLINYGFGLVVGALIAIEVAKKVPNVSYRLLVASAYSGYLIWHGGLSGSVPLLIATDGHFLMDTMGVVPVVETIFSNFNIFIVVTIFLTLPIVNRLMYKKSEVADYTPIKMDISQYSSISESSTIDTLANSDLHTFAERMENSKIISMLIGLLGLSFVVYHFATKGFDLNLNIVNFIMLFLGIILHRTPRKFLECVSEGSKNASGIIIQFPFYAGIMGMMIHSGISESMSLWFVQISNEFTFPFFAFISAGIVNFFVPSGGGQWAVQGPIMIPAGIELGVDVAKTAMAVAWGDAWTNMVQPFWTLPLLAIAGLKVKDIMGFCAVVLIYSFFPITIGLLFF
jgi:short-chain fatty acids transporter